MGGSQGLPARSARLPRVHGGSTHPPGAGGWAQRPKPAKDTSRASGSVPPPPGGGRAWDTDHPSTPFHAHKIHRAVLRLQRCRTCDPQERP